MDLGIMQGRLSSPVGDRIQAFPQRTWQNEFVIARQIGITAIEWIAESPLLSNPIWSPEGIDEIRRCRTASGVQVHFICADYFMESPFVRMSPDDLSRNRRV